MPEVGALLRNALRVARASGALAYGGLWGGKNGRCSTTPPSGGKPWMWRTAVQPRGRSTSTVEPAISAFGNVTVTRVVAVAVS